MAETVPEATGTSRSFQNQYHDPSSNLWSLYLSKAESYDRNMAQHWKGDMDTILIFAGLFSASVTAFIVESYKTLRPDENSPTVQLLAHIAVQLSNNATDTVLPATILADQEAFTPSLSAIVCNVLWFLSLSLSLICALSATLVEQWTRHYLQSPYSRPAPQDRARISAYLFQGIKKYRMAVIVEAIPLLLHLALFLFFAGLVAFLNNVNTLITYIIVGLLAFCVGLYWFISTLPIFSLASPYWTPLSTLTWYILTKLRLIHRRDAKGDRIPIIGGLQTAQAQEATEITHQRDLRDLKAMSWTISSLKDEDAFEPFAEVIPSVVSGIDYSGKWLMNELVRHPDTSVKLDFKISNLLASTMTSSLEPSVARRRVNSCIKAIWSLTMLSLPGQLNADDHREGPRFKEDTLNLLLRVQKAFPHTEVSMHMPSVMVVVTRSLLDAQVEEVTGLEAKVMKFMFTRKTEAGFSSRSQVGERYLSRANLRIKDFEDRIDACRTLTTPDFHLMVRSVVYYNVRLVASFLSDSIESANKRVDEVLRSLQRCRHILNQSGLNLALEYVDQMLRSDTLPHEPFNTLRRTLLRIQFDKSETPALLPPKPFSAISSSRSSFDSTASVTERTEFTLVSQERLVSCLEEATDHSPKGFSLPTRLPSTIISILVSLCRALSEPRLLVKAIKIVDNYVKRFPDEDEISADTLRHTLRSLPLDQSNYTVFSRDAEPGIGSGSPTVDDLPAHSGHGSSSAQMELLMSHIYADAKAPRRATPVASRSSTLVPSP